MKKEIQTIKLGRFILEYDSGNTIVDVRSKVAPGEAFDVILAEADNIRSCFKRSGVGSDWGCDGVGYHVQEKRGMVDIHRSGVGPKKFRDGLLLAQRIVFGPPDKAKAGAVSASDRKIAIMQKMQDKRDALRAKPGKPMTGNFLQDLHQTLTDHPLPRRDSVLPETPVPQRDPAFLDAPKKDKRGMALRCIDAVAKETATQLEWFKATRAKDPYTEKELDGYSKGASWACTKTLQWLEKNGFLKERIG